MTNYEVFRSCKRQFQAGGSQNNTAIKVDQLMARKKTWNKFLSASGQSVDVYNANMENGEKMETDVNEQEEGNINNVDNNNEQTATTTAAQEINLLGLTDAVQDIEIAIKVWKHHVHVLAPFNIHEWVSGLVLPELELNIVREKLSTKTRLNNSGGWTGCFSNLLVSWCLGKGGCIGQWKRGAWMHQMLKFLVHAVDLGGSVWDNYIQDPRYLGFYKNTFFDSGGQKHSHKLDFWLLVNHMYTSPAKGQCPISRFSTLYKDESFLVLPIVSNSSYDTSATADVSIKSGRPANSQSFQYLYGQHLHLAKTLIRTKAEPLKSSNIPFLSKGEDDLKCWNRQQISDKSDPFFVLGCTELQWQPFEEGLYALVIHSGAIMQPELLATFKVSCEETGELDIYPMPDTWTKWYPHLHF